jgi:hypothetical protein
LTVNIFLSLAEARARAPKIDWQQERITKPSFIGNRTFKNYPLEKLVARIDWGPFFAVWELRGKPPNRHVYFAMLVFYYLIKILIIIEGIPEYSMTLTWVLRRKKCSLMRRRC